MRDCEGCEGNAIGYPHNHEVNTATVTRKFFCSDCGVFVASVPAHITSARCPCGDRCRQATAKEAALFHALNAY